MKNLENYGVLEMNANEIKEIDGGGEKYAYFFGRAVRIAGFSAVLGPALGPLVESLI